jgi:hypothetical protein
MLTLPPITDMPEQVADVAMPATVAFRIVC